MRQMVSGLLGAMITVVSVASVADAALTTMNHELSVNNRSVINLGGGIDVDRATGGVLWDSVDDGYDNAWSGTIGAGHAMDGLFTSIRSVSSIETDSTGFVHTTTMSLDAMSTLSDARVEGHGGVTHNAYMVFDEDTELEVSLRVEYASPIRGERAVWFELRGVEDAPVEFYTLNGSAQGSGSFEAAFHVTARAGEILAMYSQIQGAVDAGFGAGSAQTGAFSLRTEIRAVPAPGCVGLLAAMSAIGGQRRRR